MYKVCVCVFYRKGKCKQVEQGHECWLGMRLRQYHMLCGALLRVWKRVADVVSDITNSSILQIVRLKTKQNSKQVGKCYNLRARTQKTDIVQAIHTATLEMTTKSFRILC